MNRRRAYLVLVGVCAAVFVLAWVALRHVSVTAATAVSVVAVLVPPAVLAVANAGNPRWDDGDDQATRGSGVEDDQAP